LKRSFALRNFVDTLVQLASKHDISSFLRPFLSTLLRNGNQSELDVLDRLLSASTVDASIRPQICQTMTKVIFDFLQTVESPETQKQLLSVLGQIRQLDLQSFATVSQGYSDWKDFATVLNLTLAVSFISLLSSFRCSCQAVFGRWGCHHRRARC
jgi:hypothetical protein